MFFSRFAFHLLNDSFHLLNDSLNRVLHSVRMLTGPGGISRSFARYFGLPGADGMGPSQSLCLRENRNVSETIGVCSEEWERIAENRNVRAKIGIFPLHSGCSRNNRNVSERKLKNLLPVNLTRMMFQEG